MLQDVLPETLPHSDDAERAVLGGVLLDNRQIHKVQELLGHDAFYAERHRKLFRAIEELSESGSALDLITVRDALERGGGLEAIGGVGYLAALVDGTARSANVEHYARIVKEKAILRELIRSAQAILSSAMRPEGSAEQVLDEAERAIFHVAEDRLRAGFLSMKTIGERSIKIIEELTHRREPITGISTGFVQLDESTAGLQPSDLVVLAARPSMGKTTLALNIAAHAALRRGRTIGMFSLEMSHQQLFSRLLCSEARVDAHRLRTGRIGKDEWQRIIKTFAELSEAPMFIDDTPGIGITEMRAKARRLKLERGLDLLVVDYLQLMRGRGRYESRQQEISDISRSLKEMAKELGIPIIALSQLSRAPEQRSTGEKRPQLSDLRESGAIEQDADVVLFLFREEVYKKDDPDLKGKAELIIGKQRNGPTGTVDLHFIREFTTFVNPEWRDG
jgi:replicative DNA helicase